MLATPEIIVELFIQMSLLVTCTFLFGLLTPHLRLRNVRLRMVVQSFLFGLFALVIMLKPIVIADGIIIDLRNVIIAVVTMLVGIVPGSVVCLVVIFYRLSLGGAGAPLAVGAALTSLILGSVLSFYRKRHAGQTDTLLLGLGVALALQSLAWLLLLPSETARSVIRVIAFPLLVVSPASSWVLGALLRFQERHRELEASLSAERNQLRTLIDNVPDYIFIKDTARRYVLSNRAYAQAAGVAAPIDLLGFRAENFFPAEYVIQIEKDNDAVLQGKSIIAQERQMVSADGKLMWVSTTKVPLQDTVGNITGIVGVSRDITAHKLAEEVLQQERNQLRTLIDNVPDYIFIKDTARRYVLSNRAYAQAAGVAAPIDLLGFRAENFFPAEYVIQIEKDNDAVLQGKSIIAQERQTVGADGTLIWVSMTKIPLHDLQGKVSGIVGISRDITLSKRAAQEAKRLQDTLDMMNEGAQLIGPDWRYIYVNDAAAHQGLHDKTELVGSTMMEVYPDINQTPLFDTMRFCMEQHVLMHIENQFALPDGSLGWFDLSIHSVPEGIFILSTDIGERKQAEQQLEARNEAERQFQTLLKALYEITLELTQIDDLDEFYRRVVELALTRLGFERIGLLLYDDDLFLVRGTYGTDSRGNLAAEHHLRFDPGLLTGMLKRVLETPEHFAFEEYTQLYSNLEPIGFGWNAAAVMLDGEQSLGWLAADNAVQSKPVSKQQLDILALYAQMVGTLLGRKRVEGILRTNESKLKTFFNILPVGISVLNPEGQIVEMNPALERILDISPEGLLNGAYRERKYISSEGRPMNSSDFPSVRVQNEQQTLHDIEVGVIKENGSTIWTSVSATALPTANSGVLTVTADITRRKRVEEALRESEARFRLLLDNLQVAFWMLDPESGKFLYISSAYETITGRSCTSVYEDALSFLAGIHPDDMEQVRQIRQAGLSSGNYQMEFRLLRPDGSLRWLLGRTFPIFDDQGTFYRIAGITEDITERKLAETQAFALYEEQQRSKLLREFVTDISHDFRTPLSIISSSTYLLGKTTDPDKLIRYRQRIDEQISRIVLLIDGFVELVALEQRSSDLQYQTIDLDEVMQTIVSDSQMSVAGKHQRLEYRREVKSTCVRGDATALTKAIRNIVKNAIYYTPDDGQIILRLYGDGEAVVVEVADTGIGIPAEDLSRIFESFYRVDSARSSETGGAGLGLSVAKKLVELMKGHIEVESELGSGSVFKLCLPCVP